MIGYLEGIVHTHTDTGIILLVGSIGYDLLGIKLQENRVGDRLSVYTHLSISSDNQPTLIGFATLDARIIFRRLLKVSGIGPKSALAIVNAGPLDILKTAILTNDLGFFTTVKGIGKKAGQKIILELKNQLIEDPISARTHAPIYEALTSLKFSPSEITTAIKAHDLSGLTESESIKIVLQSLGK